MGVQSVARNEKQQTQQQKQLRRRRDAYGKSEGLSNL
jgi:hypothetical protein